MSTNRIERIARLAGVGDDDQVDMTILAPRRVPERRVATENGKPVVDLLSTLEAEVERTRERYEAACLDLRRYQMSHGNDTRP